jgi:hypothetical protein
MCRSHAGAAAVQDYVFYNTYGFDKDSDKGKKELGAYAGVMWEPKVGHPKGEGQGMLEGAGSEHKRRHRSDVCSPMAASEGGGWHPVCAVSRISSRSCATCQPAL